MHKTEHSECYQATDEDKINNWLNAKYSDNKEC